MKALFIGGTGTISGNITRLLAEEFQEEWELYLLNRGQRETEAPQGVHLILGDINEEEKVARRLEGMHFDVVANFINFVPEQVERDIRLFAGKTDQYIFISSASAYQKPPARYIVSEATSLSNPFWQYSREKIACEERLLQEFRETGFPVTIVRPSHTYDDRKVPVSFHGKNGSWQTLDRILKGKEVIVPGDGNSLWTLTHSQDFARGFVGLMGNLHALGEAVQITSDESLTWNQIYAAMGRALNKEVKITHISTDLLTAVDPGLCGPLYGDKSNTVVFDNTKLKQLVPGFCAKLRYDQGVRRAVNYLLSHPEAQTPDKEFDQWCDVVLEEYHRTADRIRERLTGR